jgi:type IV secretory pathway protease TraF
MANMPPSAELFKQIYCLGGEKLECARYQVAVAGKAVPPNLFPNDIDGAQELLKSL